jgi:prepilin-type N-terminal cleavage/methylation domain-containing protein
MKTGDEAGFTLAELMIVVLIMGILAAFTAPQLHGLLRSYRLNGAARLVWTDVHKARMLAIKERRSVRVDFTSTSYNVVRVDTGQVIFRRNLSGDYPGITVGNPPDNSVSFLSTGTAAGAIPTVQIQGPSGSKRFPVFVTGGIGDIS